MPQKRVKKLAARFTAAVLAAGLACGGYYLKTRFLPDPDVTFNHNNYLGQKDPQRIAASIEFLNKTLGTMGDQYAPAAMIRLSGDIPEFLLAALQPGMEDGYVSAAEIVEALAAAGANLPHDLEPDKPLVSQCANLLTSYGITDDDRAKARNIANCVIYLSIAHWDTITKHVDVNELDIIIPDYSDGPVTGIAPVADRRFHIAVIGDSLADGIPHCGGVNYVDHLGGYLRERGWSPKMENLGQSGRTTGYALEAANRILASEEKLPDIVILELGGNDNLLGADPKDMRENLVAAIEKLQEAGIRVVLVGMTAFPTYAQSYQDAFNAIYPDLAKEYSLVYEPQFLRGIIADPHATTLREIFNQAYMCDSIHPNSEGARLVARELIDEVEKILHEILAGKTAAVVNLMPQPAIRAF